MEHVCVVITRESECCFESIHLIMNAIIHLYAVSAQVQKKSNWISKVFLFIIKIKRKNSQFYILIIDEDRTKISINILCLFAIKI